MSKLRDYIETVVKDALKRYPDHYHCPGCSKVLLDAYISARARGKYIRVYECRHCNDLYSETDDKFKKINL